MYKATVDNGLGVYELIIDTLSLTEAIKMMNTYFLDKDIDPREVVVTNIVLLQNTHIVQKSSPLFETKKLTSK